MAFWFFTYLPIQGKTMQMTPRRDEPSKRLPKGPERGAPPTYAAHAFRKDLSVRVLVKTNTPEPEELREHGYGHGV
jgi:hypothetical protein